ncbi:MAG: hypothetical protein R3B13_33810 [Polyangiaceae bacterium]
MAGVDVSAGALVVLSGLFSERELRRAFPNHNLGGLVVRWVMLQQRKIHGDLEDRAHCRQVSLKMHRVV